MPLQAEAQKLNAQIDATTPDFKQATAAVPGLSAVAAERARTQVAQRAARKADNQPQLAALSDSHGKLYFSPRVG